MPHWYLPSKGRYLTRQIFQNKLTSQGGVSSNVRETLHSAVSQREPSAECRRLRSSRGHRSRFCLCAHSSHCTRKAGVRLSMKCAIRPAAAGSPRASLVVPETPHASLGMSRSLRGTRKAGVRLSMKCAARLNLRIPAPERSEFARLCASWALKVARREAEPLKFTENLAHGLREIFVNSLIATHTPQP